MYVAHIKSTMSCDCLCSADPNGGHDLDCGLPVYNGFYLDVLKSIWEYYSGQKETLISPKLYELHMAVLRLVRTDVPAALKALQLCTLLLPRENRLRLYRLLRFMAKVATNRELRLTGLMSNRQLVSIACRHFTSE